MTCDFVDEQSSIKESIDLSFDSLHETKNSIEDINKFLVE